MRYKRNWFTKRVYWYITIPTKKIVKILCYIPILWRDEDYDYCFVLYLLRYKLQRMSKCIGDANIMEDTEKVVKDLNNAVSYIDRVTNGSDYSAQEEEANWSRLCNLIKCRMRTWWN